MKHFTTVKDVPNLDHLKKEAQNLAVNPHAFPEIGKGRTLGLIFLIRASGRV